MTEHGASAEETVRNQVAEILEKAASQYAGSPTGDQHHREPLDGELREIRAEILRMGALVEEAIRTATEALAAHDAALATGVIERDRWINDVQKAIATSITQTIATQNPVARDLRYLLALDHVTRELERIGDYAGSIAKQARKLAPYAPFPVSVSLQAMGETAAELLHEILRCLVDVDAVLARQVASRDDEIDEMYHRSFAGILEAMRRDQEAIEPGARALFAAHYLERIGDRVTNIAEDVVFLATGEIEDLNP